MSGRKHTTVTFESGFDRSALEADLRRRLSQVQRAQEREARAAADREAAFARRVDGLERGQQRLFDGLSRRLEQMREGTEAAVRDLQARDDALDGRLRDLEQAAGEALGAALQVIGAGDAELSHLRETYLHELFCPGEVAEAENRLSAARENAGRGRAEAALPLAHEALIRLQSLHGRLEEFQNRWERARAQACSLLEALLGAVDANRTFTLKLAGEALETLPDPPALETAFWSNGRFEALERELLGRLHTLRNDAMPPTLEMVGACGAFAANAGALLTDILQEAHDAALASVQRSDLQDGFYEKLRGAGYALVDNAWFGEDERAANHLVMAGPNGEKLGIVVRPVTDPAGRCTNEVEVNFQEHAPSEIRRREQLERLRAAMAEVYGAVEGGWTPLPGQDFTKNAPEECFDMERVRAGRAGHGKA